MHIKKIRLNTFKRFQNLTVEGLSQDTRLVVLAGPNGCGKSSLFDAFSFKHNEICRRGWDGDYEYYRRSTDATVNIGAKIQIEFFDGPPADPFSQFYFRSAYRQQADFKLQNLSSVGDVLQANVVLRKMILPDISVSDNYQRLASQALAGC